MRVGTSLVAIGLLATQKTPTFMPRNMNRILSNVATIYAITCDAWIDYKPVIVR